LFSPCAILRAKHLDYGLPWSFFAARSGLSLSAFPLFHFDDGSPHKVGLDDRFAYDALFSTSPSDC